MLLKKLLLLLLLVWTAQAQVRYFPFIENFDSVTPPALPPGWSTTTNRSSTGDFTTTKSTPRSDSNAVISTNSTISQSLISPIIDFANKEVDTLKFYERRSSTHNSGLIIEASTNGGTTFPIILSDTFHNPGTTSYVLRKLKLPAVLSNQPNVKIRWRVVGNGTGTSGTIRFDDITITARFYFDAAVRSIQFNPPLPFRGDSIRITANIFNAGLLSISNIPVEFYEDYNRNSKPDIDELFFSTIINQILQPNDSAFISTSVYTSQIGDRPIIVKTLLADDQNPMNDIKLIILAVGLPPRTLVINEIMYAPKSPEPEWIEIYNCSSDTVDLKNWKISNRNLSPKYNLTASTIHLKPGEFCVVTKDLSLFSAIHPDIESQIIQSFAIPTYLFNNNGDAVVLFDSRGAIIDSVRYSPSWGGTDGKSLERIDFIGVSNDSSNWGTSKDSIGSTPGRQNYLTPLQHNLCVLRVSAVNYLYNNTIISVSIRNTGRQPVDNFEVSLYHDKNQDTIPESTELISTQIITSQLLPKDSISITFQWLNPALGKNILIAVVNFPSDMRPKDNIVYNEVKISYPPNSLIINEIMYQPKTNEAEYVELFNPNNEAIDISGWKISDKPDTGKELKINVICHWLFVIGVGEYLVIASDSSIFNRFSYLTDSKYRVIINKNLMSLNNEGDNVILNDLTRTTIDSLYYLPKWHNSDVEDVNGRSLERINPSMPGTDRRNWSTCANPLGGTPGKQNSIYTITVPSSASLSFSPNPFSPDGDGFEDATIMCYQLPSTTSLIRVRIYDARGRHIRTLADSEPCGSTGDIVWDGYNDKRERVRIGIYIVLLEALDGNGGSLLTVKGTVVVAAKL
ncbi:MAG: lamin tail domain-containing protein [Bacteroidota bacterium]|nr:lamin tail domain-containing protein [Bacteroidota bacterium]